MGRLLFAFLTLTVAATAQQKIDFAREVHPILAERCFSCHNSRLKQGGLALDRLEGVVEGGASGAAVVPGAGSESLLIARVTGKKAPRMPMGADPLTPEQISLISAWIDEGARWEGVTAKVSAAAPIALSQPMIPRHLVRSAGGELDAFVESYFQTHGIEAGEIVADEVFARRAYLDLWGIAPTPAQLDEFAAERGATKRAALVELLLGNEQRYSEHWISFWNDLLRNDEGVIYHGGRESISDWLLGALEKNTPYDRMVRELLDPRGEKAPEGFLIGVNWRGTVNASQTPPMQAAQNSAQVFLGINIKCASCHDSFINQWKLRDSYGLAAFFSDEPLELVRCDAPTGEMAALKFLYPELGKIEAGLPLEERRAAAAKFFTMPENGRFARTIVNRYWQRLFGRGIVRTLDDMDETPWDPALLDWLAYDFVEHRYDLKHLLRTLMKSRAYQTASVSDAKEGEEFVFRGPLVRRMSAEQFVDSLSSITGEWRTDDEKKVARPSREWMLKSTPLTRALGRPVRDQVYTERNEQATTLQALELLNGSTLQRVVERGARRMLGRLEPAPQNMWDSGIVSREPVEFDVDVKGAKELYLLVRDWGSYDPERVVAGWPDAFLDGPSGKTRLSDLVSSKESLMAGAPANVRVDLKGKSFERFTGKVSVSEGSKESDINPRLRFFVFGQKPDEERLVNAEGGPGSAEDELSQSASEIAAKVYRQAYGRPPSGEEVALAEKILVDDSGQVATTGLEDLLWSLFLSPEFQLVR